MQQLVRYGLLAIVVVVVVGIIVIVVDRKDRTVNGLTLAGALLGLLLGWTTRPEDMFGVKPDFNDLVNNGQVVQEVCKNAVLYVVVLALVGWIIGFVLNKRERKDPKGQEVEN